MGIAVVVIFAGSMFGDGYLISQIGLDLAWKVVGYAAFVVYAAVNIIFAVIFARDLFGNEDAAVRVYETCVSQCGDEE